MPIPFLAIASLVSAGISAANGISQKNKANKLIASNPYPTQEIPAAILENQQKAKLYENQGLPSEQYQQAIRNINRNSTAALRSATDRRGGLGMISTINQGSNDAKLNLDVADANARRQNQQRAMQQNNQLGQWQNNVWDWNKRQRYMQTAASARALLGAGNANINQGLDRGLSGLLTSGIGSKSGDGYDIDTSKDSVGNWHPQGSIQSIGSFSVPSVNNAIGAINTRNANYRRIMG